MTSIDEVSAGFRSRERYRRAGFGYAATIAARAVSFVVAIATIPLTLPYLGPERFGMWMTMNALVSSRSSFASFCCGDRTPSLMNTIARHDGRGDVAAQRSAFSNALAIGVGLALVLSLLAVIIGPLIPWWRVFNVSSPLAISEAAPSMAVLAASFVIGIPSGLGGSVWAGLQRTYVAALFVALGSILGGLWGSQHASLQGRACRSLSPQPRAAPFWRSRLGPGYWLSGGPIFDRSRG